MEQVTEIVDKLIMLAKEMAGTAWPILVAGFYTKALIGFISSCLFLGAGVIGFPLCLRNFIKWLPKLDEGATVEEDNKIITRVALSVIFGIIFGITLLVSLLCFFSNLPEVLNPEGMLALKLLGID